MIAYSIEISNNCEKGDVREDRRHENGDTGNYVAESARHTVGPCVNAKNRETLTHCDLGYSPRGLAWQRDQCECAQVGMLFPRDVIARAKEVQKAVGASGTGAYTHSQGVASFRQERFSGEGRVSSTAVPSLLLLLAAPSFS